IAAGSVAEKARASLILGVCAVRDRAYKAAFRLLSAAEADLRISPHAETFWQVQAALASVSGKLGRAELGSEHAALAATSAQRAADALSPELRDRFLGNPTVQAAIGSSSGRSGWSRFPRGVRSSLAPSREGAPPHPLGP